MPELKQFRKENPTLHWKKRLTLLTRLLQGRSIRKARKILDNFISKLEDVKDQSPVAINQIVQQTISELNDLNESNEFIDTIEREDICDYINRAASAAGLNINNSEDITTKYRNW
jgi:hypothetical protein